jgi:fucokinase
MALPDALSKSGASLASLLDDHLFLIYTGKTRLAKNLLQRVLRAWALRGRAVTQLVAGLRSNAVVMASQLMAGDVAHIGASLSTYWAQKKRMAPLAEPAEVTAMLSVMEDLIHGASLTGAGGGGFLVGLTKKPRSVAEIAGRLASHPKTSHLKYSVHAAAVDQTGLELVIGGSALPLQH